MVTSCTCRVAANGFTPPPQAPYASTASLSAAGTFPGAEAGRVDPQSAEQGREAVAGAGGAAVRDRDAMLLPVGGNVLVAVVVALVAGYLAGRDGLWLLDADAEQPQAEVFQRHLPEVVAERGAAGGAGRGRARAGLCGGRAVVGDGPR